MDQPRPHIALTRLEKRGFWRICPEFIVELVSESDSRSTVEEKMRMWIANGVQLAWLIDRFQRRGDHLSSQSRP